MQKAVQSAIQFYNTLQVSSSGGGRGGGGSVVVVSADTDATPSSPGDGEVGERDLEVSRWPKPLSPTSMLQ